MTGLNASSGDSTRRAFYGLRQALARMNAVWEQQDGDAIFIASTEVAMWICALDEFLMDRDTLYVTRRDADPGGCIVRGLRWARNAGIHHLVDVHDIKGDLTFPMEVPASIPAIQARWKRRNNVNAALRQQQKNERAYDDHLADKPVQETLDSAFDFLWLRALPVVVAGTELDQILRGS